MWTCSLCVHRKTKQKKFADFNKEFRGFSEFSKIWWKSNFDGDKYLKFWPFINLPWGHARSHKKFGPDRFNRFDVYWIQKKDKLCTHLLFKLWSCSLCIHFKTKTMKFRVLDKNCPGFSKFSKIEFSYKQRNWVCVTNSFFLIPISLEPKDVNLRYFKLILFDLTEVKFEISKV